MKKQNEQHISPEPAETPQLGVFDVMGSFSTIHYKCNCGWEGTIHELGKDFDAMECGGEEHHLCPNCKCYSGLSLN